MLKNQLVLNEHTDFLVTIIEFLCFLDCYRNHHAKLKIDRKILNAKVNKKSCYGWTDRP